MLYNEKITTSVIKSRVHNEFHEHGKSQVVSYLDTHACVCKYTPQPVGRELSAGLNHLIPVWVRLTEPEREFNTNIY